MTVEDPTVIDMAHVGDDGKVYLSIMDGWPWGDLEHIQLLQEKINIYFGIIEDGQIYAKVPEARRDNLVIQVIYAHEPDALGKEFLDHAEKIITAEGIGFGHSTSVLEYESKGLDDT